jgi:hypothetical protein
MGAPVTSEYNSNCQDEASLKLEVSKKQKVLQISFFLNAGAQKIRIRIMN